MAYSQAPSPGPPPALPLPLDDAVRAMRAEDPTPWGPRPVVIPVAGFVVVIVAAWLVTAAIRPDTDSDKLLLAVIGNLVVQALLVGCVWIAGHAVAARHGGWGRAFGWRRPARVDIRWAAAGFGFALAGRIAIGVAADIATRGRATGEAQNIHLQTVNVATVALLAVVTVVCAPLIEELVFRGLLLRGLMRGSSFWPAALISTAIFALFHTYEVSTVAGAAVLALSVGWMGLVNCVLNRLTDRLAAGIAVHAALNLVAVLVLVGRAS